MHERHRLLQAYGWSGIPAMRVPTEDDPQIEPLPAEERSKAPH